MIRSATLARPGTLFRVVVGAIVATTACARAPRSVPAPAPAPAPAIGREAAITSGDALLQAMHDRFAGRWYRSVVFQQRTTLTSSGSETVQIWREAGRIPGSLRIDTDTLGSGVLYTGDSVYTFANGRLATADTGRNDLLVLGFDVYAQPADLTAKVLRGRGFDLSRIHQSSWRGRPVYVVGALAGDTVSKQFWVTKDELLFVRLLQQRTVRTRIIVSDIRFEKYERAGGGWIAMEVVQLADGKPRVTEEYSNLRVDVPLEDALFDARQWSSTRVPPP